MPTEQDFQAFAAAGGANVLTQSQYLALAALGPGFTSGILPSANLNKVLRQASIMAAVLGDFIVQEVNQPVIDDGSTSTILANLSAAVTAIAAAATGRLLNVRTITSSATYTPTAGTGRVFVEVVGAGGAGGGASFFNGTTTYSSVGGGGGAGAYISGMLTTGFSGAALTIGAGGTGHAGTSQGSGSGQDTAATGGTGGASSFGSLIVAAGGAGGTTFYAPSTPSTIIAVGGQGGGITTVPAGGLGAIGESGNYGLSNGLTAVGAQGGSSFFGGGGYANAVIETSPSALNGPAAVSGGSGGGGAALFGSFSSGGTGGAGAPGIIRIWEFV